MPPFDQTVNMTLTASEERGDSGQNIEEGAGYSMSMPDVTYERFGPSPKLALYVEHFWIVSAPGEQTPRREVLIPNGRPMLLLTFASPSVRIDPLTGNRFPNSNVRYSFPTLCN